MWRKQTAFMITAALTVTAAAVVLAPPTAAASGRGEAIHGDLNGDGLPDRAYLGVVQPNLCSVIAEYGLATGGYAYPRAYVYLKPGGTGTSTRCPDIGVALDLGNDGAANLVTAWFPGSPGGIDYSLLTLSDSFTPASHLSGAIFQPSSLGVADFNGDGRPDVYSVTDQGDGFETHLNTGDGTLTPGPEKWCSGPFDHRLQDFDHDGAVDVLISYISSCGDLATGVVVVMDDGAVAHLQRDPQGLELWTASVVYANGDRIPDVQTRSRADGQIATFIGIGDGTFIEAPRAVADSVTVTGSGRTIINVLANDYVSGAARIEITDPPRYGQVQVTGDRRIAYTPDPDNQATDRFGYRLTENGRQSATSVYVRFPR